jgi:hypothetical protein
MELVEEDARAQSVPDAVETTVPSSVSDPIPDAVENTVLSGQNISLSDDSAKSSRLKTRLEQRIFKEVALLYPEIIPALLRVEHRVLDWYVVARQTWAVD